MKKLRGYNIRATDGYIGKDYEFYFDDRSWSIRYLVVDIGNWFSGRQVIINLTLSHLFFAFEFRFPML
jgi:hypothetical protein